MEIAAADTASQILYAGYRFTLAGVLTIVLGSILQRKILLPKRSAIGKIGLLSLLQTVLQYLFFYIGLAHTTGVKAVSYTHLDVYKRQVPHEEELKKAKMSCERAYENVNEKAKQANIYHTKATEAASHLEEELSQLFGKVTDRCV